MSGQEHIKLSDGYEGFLFRPEREKQLNGCMIIFHERYGLVQHTLDLAQKFADDGYITLAPDLFSLWEGDKEALKRGEVRAVVSDDDCVRQIDQWICYLKENVLESSAPKIALMGVCQSGRYPIVVASQRKDLSACVVFYGATQGRDWEANEYQTQNMPNMISKMSVPLFFVFGEKDHTISIDNVLRLRNTLEISNLSYRMKLIADAPHGFLNDTMPGRYRPEESRNAWNSLLGFLKDVFEGGWPNNRIIWDFLSDKSRDYDFSKNVRLE